MCYIFLSRLSRATLTHRDPSQHQTCTTCRALSLTSMTSTLERPGSSECPWFGSEQVQRMKVQHQISTTYVSDSFKSILKDSRSLCSFVDVYFVVFLLLPSGELWFHTDELLSLWYLSVSLQTWVELLLSKHRRAITV